MSSLVPNMTSLLLVEVSFATQGSQRNSVARNLPLIAFEVIDGVAHPITTVPRNSEAWYYLSDGKRWWDKDGKEWPTWAALVAPLYEEDRRKNPEAAHAGE